jgi:hypothetical protein
MEVGDTVYAEVFSFFDIRKVKIKRETAQFFVFEIEDKEVRRKKNRFTKTKEEMLEKRLNILTFNLQVLKTNPQEIYENYKKILDEYPEILI